MTMQLTEISTKELKNIAIVGTHLHKWQGKGVEDIEHVFNEQAKVQLDPLNPAGRNHDLFFASRIENYEMGSFEKIMYPKKLVFEVYDPNLCAVNTKYFPIYYPRMNEESLHPYYRKVYIQLKSEKLEIFSKTLTYIKKNGLTSSSDLIELGKADPKFLVWKSNRLAGAALEFLWLLGKIAVVKRDNNFRKSYDLMNTYIERESLKYTEYSDEEYKHKIFKIKMKSYPVIHVGSISSKADKIIFKKTQKVQKEWFNLVDSESPHLVRLKGTKTVFVIPEKWEKMIDLKFDKNLRAIAPLDPLIWDRKVTETIFNFEYIWEVYKPVKQRRWGYYVYPLLYEGDLIGRIEVKLQKKKDSLEFFNFQKERDFEFDNESERAFVELAKRWKRMTKSSEIKTDETINFSV